MSNIKVLVLAFLQNLPESPYDQFNKAFELYRQMPSKNRGSEAAYNRRGYSEQGLKNLLYDLQKLAEISDVEVLNVVEVVEDVAPLNPLNPDLGITDATGELLGTEDTVLGTQDDFLSDLKQNDVPVIPLLADETLKQDQAISLREEFSFLNAEDCPQILYVVVGKRISAFKLYQELHAKLAEANEGKIEISEEDKTALTLACEAAFSENQALWDELNHYNTTKELLGKHPLFREENIKKEVDQMTQKQLVNFTSSSVKYFHDQKNQLEKHKDDADKLAEINMRIELREYKLALVNSKLGINAGEKK